MAEVVITITDLVDDPKPGTINMKEERARFPYRCVPDSKWRDHRFGKILPEKSKGHWHCRCARFPMDTTESEGDAA